MRRAPQQWLYVCLSCEDKIGSDNERRAALAATGGLTVAEYMRRTQQFLNSTMPDGDDK